LLDARGKELRRQRVKFRLNGDRWRHYQDNPKVRYAPYYAGLFRVWAVDLGGGADDLVYFSADRLRVMSGSLEKVRWEWPLPEEDCDLLEVRPRTAFQPAFLVVRAGSRVVFLDAVAGKPVWNCGGPGQPLTVAWGADGPPRVIYELDNEVTVCRLAQAVPEGGSGDGPAAPGPSG